MLEARDHPAALDAELVLPGRPVSFVSELTPSDVSVEPAAVLEAFGFGYDEPRGELCDDLYALRARVATEHHRRPGVARVLGWPELVQGDVMPWLASLRAEDDQDENEAGEAHADWSLLLQYDLDGPRIYVGLPTGDLAAGRFDRARAVTDFD